MQATDLRIGNYVFLDNMIKVHEIFEIRPPNIRVKYVHQLQNLFYCINGKELIINNLK